MIYAIEGDKKKWSIPNAFPYRITGLNEKFHTNRLSWLIVELNKEKKNVIDWYSVWSEICLFAYYWKHFEIVANPSHSAQL